MDFQVFPDILENSHWVSDFILLCDDIGASPFISWRKKMVVGETEVVAIANGSMAQTSVCVWGDGTRLQWACPPNTKQEKLKVIFGDSPKEREKKNENSKMKPN